MEQQISAQIRIERPLYENTKIREDFYYKKEKKTFLKNQCHQEKFKITRLLTKTIPSLKWLPRYNWKRDFVSDLISGFTVAVMHIPQGMAYGLLGNVPPVIGIYMAFFPSLVYFLLGTSRHNSMGTFAVVCLMTGKTVLEYSDPSYFSSRSTHSNFRNVSNVNDVISGYSPIQVATALTFTVALFQVAMCFLRLGAISALLSETLVSGFTTGAAVHVLSSQIKDLLGLEIPKFRGYFVIWNTLKAAILEIGTLNYAAVIISFITIVLTSVNNELFKPLLAKKTSFPVPVEFLVVVLGAVVSKYCRLEETYNVTNIGHIPRGLPEPALPPFSLIPSVLLDGFTIAIVSYTVSLSMGLIFAQKLNYEVDANQELLAMGVSNAVGSFFSCLPFCASLSRSLIQEAVGGKTQIASVVSSGILVVLLLWISPFFETAPKSLLAAIIVVYLKGLLMQVCAVCKFWKLSKMDALVWLVTFLTVVVVSIDIGLLVGIIMSLLTIFILGFKPYTCLLGSIPQTDIYLDITRYKGTKEISGIKIFHYCGGINFATRSLFKADLINLVEINPQKEVIYRSKFAQYVEQIEGSEETTKKNKQKIVKLREKINTDLRCLIMDFSSVSYLDPSGASMLKGVMENFQKIDIPVYIAACSDPVYDVMKKCGVICTSKSSVRIFPTIHDAVQCSSNIFNLNLESNISCIRI